MFQNVENKKGKSKSNTGQVKSNNCSKKVNEVNSFRFSYRIDDNFATSVSLEVDVIFYSYFL